MFSPVVRARFRTTPPPSRPLAPPTIPPVSIVAITPSRTPLFIKMSIFLCGENADGVLGVPVYVVADCIFDRLLRGFHHGCLRTGRAAAVVALVR